MRNSCFCGNGFISDICMREKNYNFEGGVKL